MIWLRPASLMVSVGDMKYLNARSRLSLSKHSALSSGSFTVLHIRSAMLRAALCRSSWSDSLHRYLRRGRGSSDLTHVEHYGMLRRLFLYSLALPRLWKRRFLPTQKKIVLSFVLFFFSLILQSNKLSFILKLNIIWKTPRVLYSTVFKDPYFLLL